MVNNAEQAGRDPRHNGAQLGQKHEILKTLGGCRTREGAYVSICLHIARQHVRTHLDAEALRADDDDAQLDQLRGRTPKRVDYTDIECTLFVCISTRKQATSGTSLRQEEETTRATRTTSAVSRGAQRFMGFVDKLLQTYR